MRGRPEHIEEVEALIERCADIEEPFGELLAAHCSIIRMSTDNPFVHLRVLWVVERLHRAKLCVQLSARECRNCRCCTHISPPASRISRHRARTSKTAVGCVGPVQRSQQSRP